MKIDYSCSIEDICSLLEIAEDYDPLCYPIFVDTFRPCLTNKNWPYSGVSHLFTTVGNIDELHKFAESIGLKKSWFQIGKDLPHYDLTKNKRSEAIENGATEVTDKFMVQVLREWREIRMKE